MFEFKRIPLSTLLSALVATSALAQSEHVVPPQVDWGVPVKFEAGGKMNYFHRHRLEVEGVPAERQAIYQSSWAGEMDVRVSGLKDQTYRVRLEYTEMDMNAPRRRIFDILINGEIVKRDVCIFNEVGNRRVLSFDFVATPVDGVITYAQRNSIDGTDVPSFTVMQVYDQADHLVGEYSAYDIRPADWDWRGYLDKIYYGPIKDDHDVPPFEGSYKIRAHESEKLTAADVIGPDGIAYPNWTNVGIPGGIPVLANTLSAADFGMVPDDQEDDSAALKKAVAAMHAQGGGVLYIPKGVYYLDRPVEIKGDNMVLRGAGMKKTRLISRFSMTGSAPALHGFAPDQKIGPTNFIYAWVNPEGMTEVKLEVNGRLVKKTEYSGHWENRVLHRFAGRELLMADGPGAKQLTATVSYLDGTKRNISSEVVLTDEKVSGDRAYGTLGALVFRGEGVEGSPIPLTRDGSRGDMSLEVEEGHGLKAGDRIIVNGPTTLRWRELLRNDHRGGSYRRNMYEITVVQGNRILIPEALRIEFPVIDGSTVQKLRPQMHCGIEDLSIEHANNTLIHSVVFEYGWESWVRGLEVIKTGNKALYMPNSKRCEVRNSVFDRAWSNAGGLAYIGWEHSFDSLMENVTTYDMRHAPVYQWSSSGNVIRDSIFHNSDAQWHAGWTNENLFEGLIVESSQDGGSYGNGMWSSGPEDTGHGPNGPRNVVYNCNITSSKVGVWMGGMNEAWLFLYNRFVVGRGPAILAKAASFDHIIQGNVFVMMEPYPSAIYLGSRDCIGIELINNRFYGDVDQLIGGNARPAVEKDNRILQSGNIARPHPPVRSIYEWQQERREEIRAEQLRLAKLRGR